MSEPEFHLNQEQESFVLHRSFFEAQSAIAHPLHLYFDLLYFTAPIFEAKLEAFKEPHDLKVLSRLIN